VIRRATQSDLSSVRQIAEQAFEPFVAAIGKKPAPMVADFAKQVDDGVVFVMTSKSAVLGYCVSYPTDAGWHVENLAVSPAVQGQGVGAKLMADAEHRARDAGAHAVELYTNVAMEGAIAAYPRLGYEEVRRAEEDGFQRVYFRKALA